MKSVLLWMSHRPRLLEVEGDTCDMRAAWSASMYMKLLMGASDSLDRDSTDRKRGITPAEMLPIEKG